MNSGDQLTFRQLEELLERKALNRNWKDFPIVMTDDLIGIKSIKFERIKFEPQAVGTGYAVVIVLEP